MGCATVLIPKLTLSWPEFPQLILLGLALNVIIYGLNMTGNWRIASRRQVAALFLITTLIMFCGYYIMYGIARPWEHAIEQWQWQASKVPLANCSVAALQKAVAPLLATSQHVFLFGLLLCLAAFVVWSGASVVWMLRRTHSERT